MDPQIGEVRLAREIGKTGRTKYVWVKCPGCTYERWAHMTTHLSPTLRLCKDCAINRAKNSFVIKHT